MMISWLIRFRDPLKDDDLSKVLVDLLAESKKEGFEPVMEESGEIKMKPVGQRVSIVSGIMKQVAAQGQKIKKHVGAILPVDSGGRIRRQKSMAPANRQEEKYRVVELLMKRELLQKTIHVSVHVGGCVW